MENSRAGRQRPSTSGSSAGQILILIVDDEKPIADLVAVAVAQAGYTVEFAYDGRQALEKAREQWPALVISDLMMPFMDGVAFIAALRQEASTLGRQTPPIVLMTAAARGRAEAVGADAVLSKPFELDELESTIQQLLPAPSG